jgi:putative NIF3 family GTP cyclohydrolase 1 type 2
VDRRKRLSVKGHAGSQNKKIGSGAREERARNSAMRKRKIMDCSTIIDFANSLFDPSTLISGEFGFVIQPNIDIQKIGYSTNLTPEIVESAIQKKVNLIVTHHDAWDFLYGMKEKCLTLLAKHKISHLFVHLPLDAAEFGPAAAFCRALNAQIDKKITLYFNHLCGRICTFRKPMSSKTFVKLVEKTCKEPVQFWKNNNNNIQTIGVVPGSATLTSWIKECVDNNCDIFLTGEKNLYTVEYAYDAGINLLVGSHTFTEIFGVYEFVQLITKKFPTIKSIQLLEKHIETGIINK